METINELKQKLVLAEKEKELEELNKELDNIKKEYEGKCYGSHTFERNNKSSYQNVTYYEKFWIENNEMFVMEHNISISRYANRVNKTFDSINYSRGVSKRNLSGNKHNCSYNLYSGFHSQRKEISYGKFKQIWETFDTIEDSASKCIYSKLDTHQDLLRIGTSQNEDIISRGIGSLGIEIIDVTKYPKLFSVIKYSNLPMFQEQRWIPKIYIDKILSLEVENIKKEIDSRVYSDTNYLHANIKVINSFIGTF